MSCWALVSDLAIQLDLDRSSSIHRSSATLVELERKVDPTRPRSIQLGRSIQLDPQSSWIGKSSQLDPVDPDRLPGNAIVYSTCTTSIRLYLYIHCISRWLLLSYPQNNRAPALTRTSYSSYTNLTSYNNYASYTNYSSYTNH